MTISLIHPSRSRPDQAAQTYDTWIGNADNPDNIEYLLSVDTDDPLLSSYQHTPSPGACASHKLINPNKTAIEAINYGASRASGELLIVISDDFSCPPHWDTDLLKALEGEKDFVAKVWDGFQAFIITLPIMDRAYYNRFGYIYNPGYKHLFCDTEMSCVAWMLNRYVPVHLEFKHNHYSLGGRHKDAVNAKNDATWSQGKRMFRERRRKNFGIKPLRSIPDFSGLNQNKYR